MKANRVLFIAYFYPPIGGPAVQRPLKLIKYLNQNNYKVDVLTVKDIQFHSIDDKLMQESQAEHIYRSVSYDPMAMLKRLSPNQKKNDNIYFNTNEKTKKFIRKLFLIDDKLAWYLPAYRLGKKLLKQKQYDYIIATMGPYTSGLIAYNLSKLSGIPLIIDYRDHWTLNTNPTNPSRFNMFISTFLEKKMLYHSELVVCVGQQMRDELCNCFGKALADKMIVMYNGFEESDFKQSNKIPNDKITIRYVGNFYGHRTVGYFISAIKELLAEGYDLSKLSIEFIGNYYKETRDALLDLGLNNLVKIIPQVTHDLAVEKINQADVLLVFIANKDGKGVLTGKLFEYLRSGSMILPMIPTDGEAADILKTLGYDKLCAEDDISQIKEYLMQICTDTFNNYPKNINDCLIYSRENQALKLINKLTPKKIKLFHLQLLPLLTGVQNVMLDMFDSLDTNKYELYVASNPHGPLINELNKRKINHLPLKFMFRTINPLDFLAFFELFFLFKKYKFDIVHTHSSKTGLLGRITAKLAGIKHIVHTSHGFAFHDFQSLFIKKTFMLLERFANNFSDKVIFVNQLQMEYAIKHKLVKSSKAVTIHNAVPINGSPRLDFHKDKLVFGSAGRFCKQKNYYNSLKIIIKVCKKFPKVEFIIIGEGDDYEKSKKLVQENQLTERIKLPGFTRERESFFNSIDVFFLNSLWEGLPLAILEAMSYGLPVLCSDILGNLDAVGSENGYLSKANNDFDFEYNLEYIIQNANELHDKGQASFMKCKERFDMNNFTNSVEQFYEELGKES